MVGFMETASTNDLRWTVMMGGFIVPCHHFAGWEDVVVRTILS